MQTFLPYADFQRTAEVLDYRRLGKQRVETWQLLNALDGLTKGWTNHPAALMWRGYEAALAAYGVVVTLEWRRRGYKDTMLDRFLQPRPYSGMPPWIGDEQFHLSHQSNLIRKDPEFYAPKFPGVTADLPYVWPITTTTGG